MTPSDRSIPPDQDIEALTGLVNLLAELQCIESPTINPPSVELPLIEESETIIAGHSIEERTIDPPVRSIPAPSELDQAAAFEQLQRLLIAPELAEFRPLVESLERKLAQVEHQIHDPSELMNLLLPWMAELLSRKIAESQEEVVQAIAPIIDQITENRAEQDKSAMSAAIAPLIAAAISRQSAQSPQEMAAAIAPTMGKAIKEQIVLERDAMVDALYPVIGSTIAKYMAEAVRAINQKIENAFSIEGIRRKLKAKLQGISEAELILQEAMPCEVQAIFLIHKASGLVISEVQLQSGERLESEMLAGMLTAIRSFANDCMTRSQSAPGTVSTAAELDQIDYGNCKILLEVAGYCYLAIVVQGEPTRQFSAVLRQTLGTIVQLYGTEIESFEGDPAMIPEAIHAMLVKLGEIDLSEPVKPRPPTVLIAAGVVLGAIAIPWSIFSYHANVKQRIQADTTAALAAAPELAVYRLNVEIDRQTLQLSGFVPNQHLRRRAAEIARTVAPSWTIDNQVQAVEVPADPTLAAAEVDRVTRVLNQTEGRAIAARYEDGKVTIAGTVSQAIEVRQVTQAFEQIPGVESIATAIQVEPLRINVRFYFSIASAQIAPADRTGKLRQIKAFLDRHPQHIFQIAGYSNPINGDRETQWLALQRAKAVRDALIQQGISPERLQIAGLSQYPPSIGTNHPTWHSRYVEVVSISR